MSRKAPPIISSIQLLYRGFRNYKTSIIALTVLGFLIGFFEAIGITVFIPAFAFLTGAPDATDPISSHLRMLFDFFHIAFSFRFLIAFIIFLFLLRTIALLVTNYIRIRIITDYEVQTKNFLFARTLQASWPYLLTQKVGHLQTVLVTHITYCQRLLNTLSSTITICTGVFVYLLAAFVVSPIMSAITLVAAALLSAFVRPIAGYTRHLANDLEVVSRNIAHTINESVLGMKIIKAMRVEQEMATRLHQSFTTYRDLYRKISFLAVVPGALMQPLSLLFIVALFYLFYIGGNFNLATFAAAVYLIQKIFLYAQQAQVQILAMSEALPFLKKTLEYEAEIVEHEEKNEGEKTFLLQKKLAFENVHFSYPGRPPVLDGVSFSIKRGEVVGLVGSSGAGKTTVSDLMLRLFNPTGGSIAVDEVPINTVALTEWRENIGYVPQDIFILNDSIANNIRFYNASITNEEIVRAAHMAYVYEFANALPEGLDTIVGEKGVLLSVGQRQRIVIARALARRPQLLILDEATSALDNVSEAVIQKIIEGLKGAVTTFIIAHRLTTVSKADRILVLVKGVIVEEGKPDELLTDPSSHFYKMHTAST